MWAACAALGYSGFENLFGVAATAGFRDGVEVEQIGAQRRRVHPVRRELHEVDARCGEDLAVFFEEEADVGVVGEVGADPRLEHGVHLGEAFFGGEVVVGEHEVTMPRDERGVVDGGAA